MLFRSFDASAEMKIRQAVQNAVAEANQTAQLALERERQSAWLEANQARQATELEVEKLRRQAEISMESEKQLRERLKGLFEELSKANKAREDAELAARTELLEREKLIREEAVKRASQILPYCEP